MAAKDRKNAIPTWTYSCYDTGETPNLWHQWYQDCPECHGSHDSVFEALESMAQWKEPYTKALGDGLIEVRLSGNKVEHRIFGFYSGERWHFTVVGVGTHKQNVYTPKDILETARRRKDDVIAKKKRAPRCVRPE